MADLYEVLGLKPDASAEEIKRAYRKIAQRTHPDKGKDADAEKFSEAARAYGVLGDEKKRLQYDRTGEAQTVERDDAAIVRDRVTELLVNCINAPEFDPDQHDLLMMAGNIVNQKMASDLQQCTATNKHIRKLEKTIKRLKRKNKKPNIVLQAITLIITDLRKKVRTLEQEQVLEQKVLEELQTYDWEKGVPDEVQGLIGRWASGGQNSGGRILR